MKALPLNVKLYKTTQTFTETSIPKGLLNNHQTLSNVWGKIVVIEGALMYVIQSDPYEEIKLTSEKHGVVEPEHLHFIKPEGKVVFYVEFYK
jgi:tellurite resistance-related uncharacterized protein